MGCCQSTDNAGPHDAPRAAPPGAPAAIAALPFDSSQVAINPPPLPSPRWNRFGRSDGAAPPENNQSSRPNQPIRAPTPVASSPDHIPQHPPPWTRSQIERERAAFFDTRVTGREEVWNALRLVCEMLRQGNVADAQTVMDTTNLSSPQGRVARDRGQHQHRGGIYDERGALYDIPAWVVTDPQDVVEDDEEKDAEAGASDDDEDEAESPTNIAARERRRDEKGKGRAEDLGELMHVRVRLSDRTTDVTVPFRRKEKVAAIIRGIQQQVGAKRVRLMYLGKVLHETKPLMEQGWKADHVLNGLIFEGDEGMLLSKKAMT